MIPSVRQPCLWQPPRRSPLARALSSEELHRRAIVFAPHGDDETLGCGGTIIRKVRSGADVMIVVMTDGAGSHNQLMPPEKLRLIRSAEVVSAAMVMGICADNVMQLGFADTRLKSCCDEATGRATEILSAKRPEQVFVPYRWDRLDDHVATRSIVLEAAGRLGLSLTVYEYPVWFWAQWPWVRDKSVRPGRMKTRLEALACVLQQFDSFVNVGDVLEAKAAAIWQYKSQMTPLAGGEWQTLQDVAGGQFLAGFFKPTEVFCRTELR